MLKLEFEPATRWWWGLGSQHHDILPLKSGCVILVPWRKELRSFLCNGSRPFSNHYPDILSQAESKAEPRWLRPHPVNELGASWDCGDCCWRCVGPAFVPDILPGRKCETGEVGDLCVPRFKLLPQNSSRKESLLVHGARGSLTCCDSWANIGKAAWFPF